MSCEHNSLSGFPGGGEKIVCSECGVSALAVIDALHSRLAAEREARQKTQADLQAAIGSRVEGESFEVTVAAAVHTLRDREQRIESETKARQKAEARLAPATRAVLSMHDRMRSAEEALQRYFVTRGDAVRMLAPADTMAEEHVARFETAEPERIAILREQPKRGPLDPTFGRDDAPPVWRVGRSLGRTLYRAEACVGIMVGEERAARELAAAIVERMNAKKTPPAEGPRCNGQCILEEPGLISYPDWDCPLHGYTPSKGGG